MKTLALVPLLFILGCSSLQGPRVCDAARERCSGFLILTF